MRTYELAIVADPRLSDDEMVALTDEYKQLITTRGGEIVREESWGKRKLAYPIDKLTEGRYVFLFLQMEPKTAALIPEVELRLNQNDKVLRYLTVRTDLDLKRAVNRAKPGQAIPGQAPSAESEESEVAEEES
ncbi:MAG: 30S ribosomal protein S6 [Acidobacteria bacterium]|nr:30S ribosomal protein S6 [Acidobacteriota bacterium]